MVQTQLEGIACRRLYTPRQILDNVLVQFDGPRIASISELASPHPAPGFYDAQDEDLVVTPGFVDTHIHGCSGADFIDRSAESFEHISNAVLRGGTTSLVCTTTLRPGDSDLEDFAEFMRLYRAARPSGARLLGLHLEGPFLNKKKRGGFGEEYILPVDLNKAARILELCADVLLKVTIAPEIDQAEQLIRLFLENPRTSVEICLGHTSADYDLACRCFAMERVRQVTHAFNAMNPFHHRSPGLVGAALLDERVWLEMVPDGYHLSGPAIALLHRMKGPQRLMIITDGTAVTATEPGTKVKNVGGITEVRDGTVRLPDGTIAGSNLLMSIGLERAQRLGGVPFVDALEMCTRTPAASIHREHEIGSIEPGKLADFCVLKKDGSVATVIRDGKARMKDEG